MGKCVDNRIARPLVPACLLGASVVLYGCAPSIGRLQAYVNAGDYDKAVSTVAGDDDMQTELAALVLEKAAASDNDKASEIVDSLSGAGAPGKRALKRLARESKEPASSLAKIALKRFSRPRNDDLDDYLRHESSDVRASACRAWALRFETEALAKLLLDKDARVRKWAAESMCSHAKENARDSSLREVLRLDPDPKVRAVAARCPKTLGDDPIFVLKTALKDGNLGVRLAAIQGLSELTDETGKAVLEDMAKGPLDESAVAAASELARLGGALGKERLNAALADERAAIRQAAILQLDRSGMENRDEILIRMLDDGAPEVIILAASMLSSREDVEPTVTKALKKIVDMNVERSAEARDMSAVLGDEDSLKKVSDILKTGKPDELISVLNRVQRAVALKDIFVKLMAHESETVRRAAARAVLVSSGR